MNKLRQIAHRVMIQRGLLPDFSPMVLAEVRAITEAPVSRDGAVRDLRELLWASIDKGASEKGTWVRILHPATEGRVVRGMKGLDVGDRVHVELVQTDVERGFIDFARV
jgi:hypothetical protein